MINLAASVPRKGKTAGILLSSLTLGSKKMLSACFADINLEHTEMDSSDNDFRKMTVMTSDGYYILGHFENQH